MLIACDYEPEGVNPVQIDPLSAEDIGLTMRINDGEDTVYARSENQYIRYTLEVRRGDIQNIKFSINDIKVHDTYGDYAVEGSFRLRSESIPDGYYTLEAEVLVDINTGSWAEEQKAVSERILIVYQQPIVVRIKIPQPPKITAIEPYEGSLRIEWEPYTREDFVSYQLYNSSDQLIVIDDPTVTEYIDNEFIGGRKYYQVSTVYDDYKDSHYFPQLSSGDVLYEDSFPEFYSVQNTDTTIALSWSKTKYPANLHHYSIYRLEKDSYGYSTQEELVKKTENPDDTTCIDSAPFSSTVSYRLYINRNEDSNYTAPADETEKQIVGTKGEPFTRIWYRPATKRIYMLDQTGHYDVTLQSLDESSFEVNRTVDFDGVWSFTISEDASIAYRQYGFDISAINLSDFSVVKTFSKTQLVGGSVQSSSKSIMRVSNTNRLVMDAYTTEFLQDIVIVDMDSAHLHSRHTFDGVFKSLVLSPNGEYFARNQTVYKITTDSIQEVGQFPFIGDYTVMNVPDEYGKFMVVDDQRIRVFNWSDVAAQNTKQLAHTLINPTIDPKTGYVGGVSKAYPEQYLIYDYNSGQLVRQVSVYNSTNYKYYFYNSTLFSSGGYYLPLTL